MLELSARFISQVAVNLLISAIIAVNYQEITRLGNTCKFPRLLGSLTLDGLTRVTGIGPARLKDIKDEGKAYVG